MYYRVKHRVLLPALGAVGYTARHNFWRVRGNIGGG
jgi:hypothetical protein